MSNRSPKYPSISLKTALEGVRRIWAEEKRSAFPPTVAVQHLGYSSINGASKAHLSGLRQYGLVKNHDQQTLELTPLAISLVAHPENSQEHQSAIREAALTPKLFQELAETHSDASDASLRAHLITAKGFVNESAKRAIKAFRDTQRLILTAQGGLRQGSASEGPGLETNVAPAISSNVASQASDPAGPVQSQQGAFLSTVTKELRLNISRDTEAYIVFHGPVTQEGIEKLAALLELQKDTFPARSELERTNKDENE